MVMAKQVVRKAKRPVCGGKQLFLLLILLVAVFAISGCNSGGDGDNDTPAPPAETISWSQKISINDVDEIQSVVQTEAGGYVTAGSSVLADDNRDVLVVKLDSLGAVVWSKNYGQKGSDTSSCVLEFPGTGYLIAGQTGLSDGTSDIYLLCIDSDGNVLWEKTYGGVYNDMANSIAHTSDNGFIVAGSTVSHYIPADAATGAKSSEDWDAYYFKIDNSGNVIWKQTITDERYTGEDEYGLSARETMDGDFILAGNSLNSSTFGDILLVRTDGNGTKKWTKTFGESYYEESVFDVVETQDYGFILTGLFNSSLGGANKGCLVLKTDSAGNQVWSKIYQAAITAGAGNAIVESKDKSFVVTGYAFSHGNSSNDIYLVKFDGAGNITWERFFGDMADEKGISVQVTSDGGYIVAGNSTDDGLGHIRLFKTDKNGEIAAK
ncbi:MAG: hypothetical protein JEZ12_02690 [Desulfobacterium sp.]|nr:hypothetical protein [Desulfobacterium sp.]